MKKTTVYDSRHTIWCSNLMLIPADGPSDLQRGLASILRGWRTTNLTRRRYLYLLARLLKVSSRVRCDNYWKFQKRRRTPHSPAKLHPTNTRNGDKMYEKALIPSREVLFFSRFYGKANTVDIAYNKICLLYTSPSPRDRTRSRMPSSA